MTNSINEFNVCFSTTNSRIGSTMPLMFCGVTLNRQCPRKRSRAVTRHCQICCHILTGTRPWRTIRLVSRTVVTTLTLSLLWYVLHFKECFSYICVFNDLAKWSLWHHWVIYSFLPSYSTKFVFSYRFIGWKEEGDRNIVRNIVLSIFKILIIPSRTDVGISLLRC